MTGTPAVTSRARRERWVLPALCLLTVLARVLASWLMPSVAHPDETFQYLEQAQRLLGGRGMVPWEFVVGARSWLLPIAVVPALAAGRALSADPAVWLWCVTAEMTLFAMGGTAAAYVLGRRVGGPLHGAFAGLLAATWCEFVQLSPHVLADTLAAVPLVAAFAVGYRAEAPSRRRLGATGFLFGLAFIVRVQLAPAILVALLGIGGLRSRSRQVPLGLGFAAAVLLLGVLDWITLGLPYASVYTYVRLNGSGIADLYGTTPPSAYLLREVLVWGAALPLVALTAALGGRRLPLMALVAVTIVATFSLVPHKEPRFIYPALVIGFVLCGVGSADLSTWLARVARARWVRLAAPAALAAVWIAGSVAAASREPMLPLWHKQAGWLAAFRRINADPSACGVGVPSTEWMRTGTVRFRSTIALFDGDDREAAPSSAAYDYLVTLEAGGGAPKILGAFERLSCTGEAPHLCLYRRSGDCDASKGRRLQADPGAPVSAILRRLGYRSAP